MADCEEILNSLLEGGKRFAQTEDPTERAKLATGQSPKVAVLYCSDSREVVEKLLGIERRGEIFGIRLAGEVASQEAIDSVVYGIERLHIPLVMVLGHVGCGAVAAKNAGSHLKLLDLVEPNEETNVRKQVERLLMAPEIKIHANSGTVRIVGAMHNLKTGEIKLL